MTCLMCKGKMEEKTATFVVDYDDGMVIIVKNVPTRVCVQCGEKTYRDEVAKQLEKIVQAARIAMLEVAIVNYSDRVA